MLVVVCGLQGTGKSTLARRLAEASGFAVLSSDRIRKQLAGLPPTHDPRAPPWLYTPVITSGPTPSFSRGRKAWSAGATA
jgi:predicted kinase